LANVVLSLHNPNADGVDNYKGYNIKVLGDHFRELTILANRDGLSDISIGLLYHGKPGTFNELPRPDDEAGLNIVYNELRRLNGTT